MQIGFVRLRLPSTLGVQLLDVSPCGGLFQASIRQAY
jgi:hypothetical protein